MLWLYSSGQHLHCCSRVETRQTLGTTQHSTASLRQQLNLGLATGSETGRSCHCMSTQSHHETAARSKRSEAAAVSQVKVHMSSQLRRFRPHHRHSQRHSSHRARITVWQHRPCTCPMSLFVCVLQAECVWTEPNISTAALRVIKTSTDTQLAFILSLRPP